MPVIMVLAKKSSVTQQKLQLYKHEFESTGARDLSGYSFNLEIVNGKAVNDISGTAVARDLLFVLCDNKNAAEFLKGRHIKISINKLFILSIAEL